MPVYDTPYYGARRKALTGMGYGPYYGMELTGGGALPTEGRRALPPEISEKYGATGTPAITESPETAPPSPPMEGQMSDDPDAMAVLGYGLLGIPSQAGRLAFPSPTFKGYGVLGTAAKYGVSTLGGPPIIGPLFSMAMRTFINPLLAALLPGLGIGTPPAFSSMPNISFNMATGQFDVDRSITPMSQKGVFTGLPDLNISRDIGVLQSNVMGVMGPGAGGLGSPTGIGQGEGGAEGGY